MKFREQHLKICEKVYEYWWDVLERDNEIHLEPSWIYDLDIDCERQYPNHKVPGVYIFFTNTKVLEIGKSKNAMGPQLTHDLKWVLERMGRTGEESALTTVYVPIVKWKEKDDVPLDLEKYLINKLNPDRTPFPFNDN